MMLSNPQEHFTCFYHECGQTPIMEIFAIERSVTEKRVIEKSTVIFILEGNLHFRYRDYPEGSISKGRFLFIPSNGKLHYTATHKSTVLAVRLPKGAFLCKGCNVEELYKKKTTSDKKDYRYREAGLATLEIIPVLWSFIEGLKLSITGELMCRYYFELKTKEMMVLLRAFYPREDLREFFSLILSPDTEFSEYIRENHHKYRMVAELAASMHMTPKCFAVKFAEVFGEPPLRWMIREKARCVYAELYSGAKPIAQIADEYGFLSQPHFNKFCKREFGKNPGEIRGGKMYKKRGNWEK